MKEIWKPVVGFEEYFTISNLGKLKRIKEVQNLFGRTKREVEINRIVKPTLDRGYLKINLSINGKRTLKYIHRMVAEAFIPNPNNYKEVNHKDNNPSNNNVNNLEWCDRKYNIEYMVKHQEKVRENNELRLEMLENIYYGIELGKITTLEQVKNMIDEELLNEY